MANHNFFYRSAEGAMEPATHAQILNAAREILASCVRWGAPLTSPQQVCEYLTMRFAALDYEVFGLILVDVRRRVIECVELFRGTIDGTSVHPREVVKLVLAKGASACIAFHNHPSGVQECSHADELVTRRLKEALSLVDVRLIDHVIVGNAGAFSFAERGLL